MTVFRTFDPTLINRIANIPEVRATVGLHVEGKTLDFSDCAKRPNDYIILTNGVDAVSLYVVKTPTVLEGHSIFDLTCRGKAAIEIGRQMFDWLFTHTPTLIITGATPTLPAYRPARFFSRKIGMKSDGIRTLDGEHWKTEYEYFHILKSEWETARTTGLMTADK